MEKKIRKILIVITIILLVYGIFSFISIMNGQSNTSNDIYIDGTNATPFINAFTEVGNLFLSMMLFGYFLLIIFAFWIIYFIILGIMKLSKKIKNRQNNK